MIYFGNECLRKNYTLSEHLAINVLYNLETNKHKGIFGKRDQMIIGLELQNIMRCGHYLYIWDKYKLKPHCIKDPYFFDDYTSQNNQQKYDVLSSACSNVFYSSVKLKDKERSKYSNIDVTRRREVK